MPETTLKCQEVRKFQWVPVEERLPEADYDDPLGEYVQVAWKPEWHGKKLANNPNDYSIVSPCGIDTCFIPYFVARHFHQATHWRKLDGPPSSSVSLNSTGPQESKSPVQQPKVRKGDWYCPKCKAYISAEQVTFEETHDTCGAPVYRHKEILEIVRHIVTELAAIRNEEAQQ